MKIMKQEREERMTIDVTSVEYNIMFCSARNRANKVTNPINLV